MKTEINKSDLFHAIMKILYFIILVIHMVMGWTLIARSQTRQPAVIGHPVHPAQSRRDIVRKVYTSQIGLREKQPNSGPDVEKYLHYVNLPKGNPWCAAFVCWVYGQAGIPNPRTGWSPDLFPGKRVIWVRIAEKGKLKTENPDRRVYSTSLATGNWHAPAGFAHRSLAKVGASAEEGRTSPSTGDVFGIYFPEKGRIAHVGFVDEWNDPWVITVEGNTNVLGSREGDGVYRKRRLTGSVYKVARYIN